MLMVKCVDHTTTHMITQKLGFSKHGTHVLVVKCVHHMKTRVSSFKRVHRQCRMMYSGAGYCRGIYPLHAVNCRMATVMSKHEAVLIPAVKLGTSRGMMQSSSSASSLADYIRPAGTHQDQESN